MKMPGIFSAAMNPQSPDQLRVLVVDLRKQLQAAMGLIQSVSEQLAAVSSGQTKDPDRSFQESRAREAKSEVDSGEFDVHG